MSLFGLKNYKNQGLPSSCTQSEHGGAIIWIFVMIGLFGALSFAVNQGSRGGAASLSEKQAELAASEILDYARNIKSAVRMLQINGCDDTEVSFDQAFVSGYSNPNSPSDQSCHVFNNNGGGLRYQSPNSDWLDSAQSSAAHYGEWFTNSNLWVAGVGTDGSGSNCAGGAGDGSCRELVTGIPFLKNEVCKALNKSLNWGKDDTDTPIQDSGIGYASNTHIKFQGTYLDGNQIGTAIPSTDNFSDILSGCIEGGTNPASGTYHFFQVLIAR